VQRQETESGEVSPHGLDVMASHHEDKRTHPAPRPDYEATARAVALIASETGRRRRNLTERFLAERVGLFRNFAWGLLRYPGLSPNTV